MEEVLEKYRSIPITLNLANSTVTDAVVSSGLDCRGRVLDLTIVNYDGVADLIREDIEVVLMWHHVEAGESNLRRFTPVDAAKGRFRCNIPVAMSHLGRVQCSVVVLGEGTEELPAFMLPSLSFDVRIESEFWFGREFDTCDDFNDIQLLIVEHRRLLNDLLEALENDRIVFDAQQADFDRRYNEREDIRDGWYREREYERDDMYKDAEAHRDWEFDNYRDLTIAALGGAAAAHLQRQINWLSRTLSDVDFVRAVTESRDGDDVVVPDVEDFLTDAEFGELLGEGDAHA